VTHDELIGRLRASEASLYTPRIQNLYLERDDEDRAAFVQLRQSVAALVNDVTTLQLEGLNDALAAHDAALSAGLAELESALGDAADHKTALRRVTTAVQILSGVAGAVGTLLRQ
jgi:hypothetical protein